MVVAPDMLPTPEPACEPETEATAPVAETEAELALPESASRLIVPVFAMMPPVELVEDCVIAVPIEFVPAAVSIAWMPTEVTEPVPE